MLKTAKRAGPVSGWGCGEGWLRRSMTAVMLKRSALWRSSSSSGWTRRTWRSTGAMRQTDCSESWVSARCSLNQGWALGPTARSPASTPSDQGWMRNSPRCTGVPRASVAAASMRGRSQSGSQ